MSQHMLKHKSTAFFFGVSSWARDDAFKATNAIVEPLLKADLQRAIHIPFDRLLHGLGADPKLIVDATNDPEICRVSDSVAHLYESYKKALESRGETVRYQPFCDLANGILDELYEGTEGKPIIFVRNDPKTILGNFDYRQKPDVVVVPTRQHVLGNYITFNEDCLPYDLKESNLTWHDVLSVVEFRFVAKRKKSNTGELGPSTLDNEEKTDGQEEVGDQDETEAEDENEDEEVDNLEKAAEEKDKEKEKELDSKLDDITTKLSEMAINENPNLYKDYKIQLMRYAVNQLSVVFNRRHCISILVIDKRIIMVYCDHGGLVQSSIIDIGGDLHKFIVFLKTFAGSSPQDFGFIEGVERCAESNDSISKSLSAERSKRNTDTHETRLVKRQIIEDAGKLAGQRTFVLDVEKHRILVEESILGKPPFGLIGRGSRVHKARILWSPDTSPVTHSGELAVKASWQLLRRPSEKVIVDRIRKILEDPESKNDGSQGSGGNLVDSLPTILLSEDITKISSQASLRVRAGLSQNFDENRICRIMLLEKLDEPLCKQEEKTFRKGFRQVFEAHYWIATKANILHRDISISNLMVRKSAGGTTRGVLIDWDLAEDRNNRTLEPRTGTRTGTRPFMARDLHAAIPPEHTLRFDWESFLYVLLWTVYVPLSRNERDKAKKAADADLKNLKRELVHDIRDIIKDWYRKGDTELYLEKTAVLSPTGLMQFSLSPCRFRSTFKEWIYPMWRLFVEAETASSKTAKTPWEDKATGTTGEKVKTVDEVLTYEALSSILAKEPK